MNLPHPYDWIAHAILCFTVCLFFGWKIAATVGLTIEGTQLESGFPLSYDNFVDIVADSIGIVLAVILTRYIKRKS